MIRAIRALRHGIALVATAAVTLGAQVPTDSTASSLGRARMAERSGAWSDAATLYGAVLAGQPANVGALLGMEHVLPHLARQAELVRLVGKAVQADSTGVGVLGVAVDVFAAQGMADSARRYADRWSRLMPRDEDPYRAWYQAAETARDLAQARQALDAGRQRLGPAALGIDRAAFFQRAGDIGSAVDEWVGVVRATPAMRDAAVTMLSQVTASQRPGVLDALAKNPRREAHQMLGLLQATWGDPAAGVATMQAALPANRDSAVILLRRLYDVLHARGDNAARAASAATLEALAPLDSESGYGPTMLDAARAYADAGDQQDARRVMTLVTAHPGAAASGTAASTALLDVLIAEGKAADAQRTLHELAGRIDPDQHDAFARRIAELWARQGALDRADSLVAPDSSTEGLGLRGRLRLYRGDLAAANDLLRMAGPYDDVRDDALARVALLTLIQAVGTDSSRLLGASLLAAERGDTAAAVLGLTALAATLKGDGAAEARIFTARLALAAHDSVAATALLRAADIPDAPGPAAAARLALARLSIAGGRRDEARALLEHLIVDFPESAVVPEARRLRDQLIGAIPAGGG